MRAGRHRRVIFAAAAALWVVAFNIMAQEHAEHASSPQKAEPVSSAKTDAIDHAAMGHDAPESAQEQPRDPVPAPTAQARAAAFPDIEPHRMHDDPIVSFVLVDRLEAWDADPGTGMTWQGRAWIGQDLDRLWIRSQGERSGGATEAADLELFYGRSVSRWWDLVAGVRHDFAPGPSQTWAALGVQGLAPYKFEIEATLYLAPSGRTAARIEAEYELLLTNRLILQPEIEFDFAGKSDAQRETGAGLTAAEAGLRLRYEVTRRFAPYIGLVHERAFGRTADLRNQAGAHAQDTKIVAGLRFWF